MQYEATRRHLAERISELALQSPLIIGVPTPGLVLAMDVARGLGVDLDFCCIDQFSIVPHRAHGAPEREMNDGDDSCRTEPCLYVCRGGGEDFDTVSQNPNTSRCDLWRRVLRPEKIKDRDVIVVDAAIRTGATISAVLEAVSRQEPKFLAAAVPLAMAESLASVAELCDELIVLRITRKVEEIHTFCRAISEVSDIEITAGLRQFSMGDVRDPGFLLSDRM